MSLKMIRTTPAPVCGLFFFLVKEKEDLHPDPEVQSAKDETFGEYR